jgi:nicotinamidase-related amidase
MPIKTLTRTLLILDPQNDFFGKENPNLSAFLATIPVINETINLFRDTEWPVIFIQHTSKRKPEGSQNWKIHAAFNYKEDDICINKNYYDAFWKTRLEEILQLKQVESVIVCGYLSEYCVLSTLRGAVEREFDALILEGAIASFENRYTQFTLEISPTISPGKLETSQENCE